MDLNAFMEAYSEEIGGSYSEYDGKTSIIIVPLPDQRFQTVLGTLKPSEKYDKLRIEFTSKVCALDGSLDLKALLEENSRLNHAKFAIADDFVIVEASSFVDSITEEIIKEIIQEVANVADEFEFKLAGVDVH
ncbi:MAG: hypothetical protein AAFN93_00750 [Bacteroidota bacterium]